MSPRGFTLLEMVVVLAILGLAASIAAPAALRGVDAWQRRGVLDAVLDQVRGLPAMARVKGRELVVDDVSLASPDAPLRAAEGWLLKADAPWRVRYNGVCDPGVLRLEHDGRVTRIEVAAPFCTPTVAVD